MSAFDFRRPILALHMPEAAELAAVGLDAAMPHGPERLVIGPMAELALAGRGFDLSAGHQRPAMSRALDGQGMAETGITGVGAGLGAGGGTSNAA